MEWLKEAAGGTRYFVIALMVSLLSGGMKRLKVISDYISLSAHLISGLGQAATFAVILYFRFISIMEAFIGTAGYAYISTKCDTDTGDYMGVGLLGLINFFIRPTTWIYLYLLFEGVVRAVEAATTGQHIGSTPFWLIEKSVWLIRREAKKRKIQFLAGSERPDEVIHPKLSPSGLLEIYSTSKNHGRRGRSSPTQKDSTSFSLKSLSKGVTATGTAIFSNSWMSLK